jgi:Tfp pilus assembly protein PilV
MKTYYSKSKYQSGQSLFELVLSIGVSAVIIVVLVALVNNAVQGAAYSRNQTLATRYAESGMEWVRTQRDADITTFLTKANAMSYCLKNEPPTWQSGVCGSTDYVVSAGVTTIFKRQVTFPAPTVVSGKNLYTANLTVTWTDSKGTHTVNNSTQFTDWRQR